MEINLKKCWFTDMDMRTGQQLATDSVMLHEEPFPVAPPSELHKHLGLRATRARRNVTAVGGPGRGQSPLSDGKRNSNKDSCLLSIPLQCWVH
jgi:hypothetical protein